MGGDPSGALRVALGRAPAEALYCGLAIFGVAALLGQFPGIRFFINLLGTVVFAAVGLWLIAQQATRRNASIGLEDEDLRRINWGSSAGFVISILNPTLIISWSAIVAFALSIVNFEPAPDQKLAFPLGLGLGIVVGYMILVEILRRYVDQIDEKLIHLSIRLMGAVFIALALWNALKLLELA